MQEVISDKKYFVKSNFLEVVVGSLSYEEAINKFNEIFSETQPTEAELYFGIFEETENGLFLKHLLLSTELNGTISWTENTDFLSNSFFFIDNLMLDPLNVLFNLHEVQVFSDFKTHFYKYLNNGSVYSVPKDKVLSDRQRIDSEAMTFFVKGLSDLDYYLKQIWELRKERTALLIKEIETFLTYLEEVGDSLYLTLDKKEGYFSKFITEGTNEFDMEVSDFFVRLKVSISNEFTNTVLSVEPVSKFQLDSGLYAFQMLESGSTLTYLPYDLERDYSDGDFGSFFKVIANYYTLSFDKHFLLPKELLLNSQSEEYLLQELMTQMRFYLASVLQGLKKESNILSEGFSYAYINQRFAP